MNENLYTRKALSVQGFHYYVIYMLDENKLGI